MRVDLKNAFLMINQFLSRDLSLIDEKKSKISGRLRIAGY